MVLPLLKWTWIPVLPQMFLMFSLNPFSRYHQMDVAVVVVGFVVLVVHVLIDLCSVVFVVAFDFKSIQDPIRILAPLFVRPPLSLPHP